MKHHTTPLVTRYFAAVFLIVQMFFLGACSKNDDLPSNPGSPAITRVQFAKDQYHAGENSTGMLIYIDLQNKATIPGRIAVKLQSNNASYGTDYVTEPEAINGTILLPISQGSEKISFKVLPLNNDVRNTNREVTFTLSQEESIFKPEGIVQSKLLIADDETFAIASFGEAQASLMENAAVGYTVQVALEPAAAAAGFIEIELHSTNALYDQHYYTLPAAENGKLRLPVQEGNGIISFVMYAKDNLLVNTVRKIRFKLAGASENIQFGSAKEMNFFIDDNDDNTGRSISSIRDIFTGNAYVINTTTRITGVVTSFNDNLDAKVMYVEDATGGIAIRFSSRHSYNAGDVVMLDLNGSILSETNGILNISQISNGAATRIGFQTRNIPSTSPSSLYHSPEILEGRIVKLENVRFINADGITQLLGDQRVTDGGRQVIVRTEAFASFANRLIPAGNVSVTGILVWRNNEYTIYPQKSNDIN